MADLKPCPFCGGEAELQAIRGDNPAPFAWDVIHHCGAGFIRTSPRTNGRCTQSEAISAWNTRATQPDVTALVEAATALRDQIARWHDGAPPAGPDESKALFEALDEALTAWEAAQC